MRELLLRCAGRDADTLTDALMQAGALAASVQDAELDTPNETPIFGEPGSEATAQGWDSSLVLALIADGMDPAQVIEAAQAQVAFELDAGWQCREVPEQDWVKQTQAQFDPIEVGHRLLIVPTWHREDIKNHDRHALILDPGLAFGTGSHPTTHLCLRWLDAQLTEGASVLDYGCGSGILAIAAGLLGASHVVGVDIDEQAVLSTQQNAQANDVQLSAVVPKDLAPGTFDVVLANILSNPLKVLAPMLCHRAHVGGWVVLSGILSRQAQEVAQYYTPWVNLVTFGELDGWVCLAGRRKPQEIEL